MISGSQESRELTTIVSCRKDYCGFYKTVPGQFGRCLAMVGGRVAQVSCGRELPDERHCKAPCARVVAGSGLKQSRYCGRQ